MDLSRLNPQQKEAVLHGESPLLVLAGAGTGKTTVITYRLAHFVQERGVSPQRILAVTFTNKAAKEMRERVAKLLGVSSLSLDIGTFHGICGRVLRRYGSAIGLAPNFVIYDQDDQTRLLKHVAEELKVDTQAYPVNTLRFYIERWKNSGKRPNEAVPSAFDRIEAMAHKVYLKYQAACLQANAVDFGDMLLHVVTLLRDHEDVRASLQHRWSHILVDEYQDTNRVQYELLQLLVSPAHSLTVVGDDDQSIYRWRGADIGNILSFEQHFPNATLIRLEQNYRSTQNILDAANAVIANNAGRKGKTLFTEGEQGTPLVLRVFPTERDEGEGLANSISRAINDGADPAQLAVLYRTNAQSRPIEDALRRHRIPYAVYGGMRFYDRREVRDALAYLRMITNPQSDMDFLRVVNMPARGIGKTSLEKVLAVAQAESLPLFVVAQRGAALGLSGKAASGLARFVKLILQFQERAGRNESPVSLVSELLEESEYLSALRLEDTPEAQERIDNLSAFVGAIGDYMELVPEGTLSGFLEEAALATDLDGMEQGGSTVSLMTLHSAKGLEFDTVFLPGLEDGLFPHSRSRESRAELEEERRLCYVGLTRARKNLHLSAATLRSVFGDVRYAKLSPFLAEIPDHLITTAGAKTTAPKPLQAVQHVTHEAPLPSDDMPVYQRSSSSFSRGSTVFHASFGEGRVVSSEGGGTREMLTIDFAAGRKVVVARFVERR